MYALFFSMQVHIDFVKMGAKFDAVTKKEYADIQGKSSFGLLTYFVLCVSSFQTWRATIKSKGAMKKPEVTKQRWTSPRMITVILLLMLKYRGSGNLQRQQQHLRIVVINDFALLHLKASAKLVTLDARGIAIPIISLIETSPNGAWAETDVAQIS